MNDPNHSEDTRDQELARRIGALLEQGVPLSDPTLSEDPLYKALLSTKTRLAGDEAGEAPPFLGQRLWARIERETAPVAPRRIAHIASLRPALTWSAVAAAILIMVALWLVWRQAGPEPVLVATAGERIEQVSLPDGSTIHLRPHSSLYRLRENTYRLTGEGFFQVTHDERRRFSVEAGQAVVTVLGTKFNVNSRGAETRVFLEEGRVQLSYEPTGRTTILRPGQEAVASARGIETRTVPASGADATDWVDGVMEFSAKPLRDVVSDLERHYGVAIDVPDGAGAERLSGAVQLDSLEPTLDDLGVVAGGRFVRTAPNAFRYVPE